MSLSLFKQYFYYLKFMKIIKKMHAYGALEKQQERERAREREREIFRNFKSRSW
jgi:hypothetical protein